VAVGVEAHIIQGAYVIVGAGLRVGNVGATGQWVARIVGTGIRIIANQRRRVDAAISWIARLDAITYIIVITDQSLAVHAAAFRNARLHAIADIAVVAFQRLAGNASLGRVTRFDSVTGIIIVANQGLTVQAPCLRVACFVAVTGIIVITDRGLSGTFAVGASVAPGAFATIVARLRVVLVDAPDCRVAGVIGAVIVIVA
jgi:hypothetical protein